MINSIKGISIDLKINLKYPPKYWNPIKGVGIQNKQLIKTKVEESTKKIAMA